VVQELTETLKHNGSAFKDYYKWVFKFSKDAPERKTLDKDVALSIWDQLLPGHFPLLPQWLEFYNKSGGKTVRTIQPTPIIHHPTLFFFQVTRDLWDQVYDFGRDIKPDLSNWVDDGAWPVAIDEFVEELQKEKAE
jgi:hypothetical protein